MEEENNVGSQVKNLIKRKTLKYVAIGVAIILAVVGVLSIIIGIIAAIFSNNEDDGSGGYTYIGGIVGGDVETKVYNALKNCGYSDIAIAGLMANMKQESQFISNNLQQDYETILGYTDETYTADVDNGDYTNFVGDSAGYGLVQWTYYTVKQDLYDYAKYKGVSIGDADMQIEVLLSQLGHTEYSSGKVSQSVFPDRNGYSIDDWKNATDIETATKVFCWVFENAGTPMMETRITNASDIYDNIINGKYDVVEGVVIGGTQIDTTNSTSLYWGKYRSNSGRVYTLYKQNDAPGVPEGHCYYTSIAIIKSGFGDTRNQIAYNSSVGNPLTAITSSEVQTYLKSGGAVMIYADFYGSGTSTGHGTPETFYCGSGRKHAIALLDIDENNNVFVANPYYIGNGSEGQKGGGWYPLSKMLSYKNLAGTANAASYYGIK